MTPRGYHPIRTVGKRSYIRGGLAEQRQHVRHGREDGMWIYWSELQDNNCLNSRHGWLRIAKVYEKSQRAIMDMGHRLGAGVEIGYRRLQQELIRPLWKSQKPFRRAWMEKAIPQFAAYEWELEGDNPLAILGVGKLRVRWQKAKGTDEVLFQHMKETGELDK